ncbi:MAG TPA: gliding motility protein GldC [Balneolales bacterium]|nr:gliding motility protein GldC [Balneolales bacterium]
MSVKKEINITVELDDENIPKNIVWDADDSDIDEPVPCKSMIMSLWDHEHKNTLRLDLWTRDMMQDEMKIFFHQVLVGMSDTLEKAIGDERIAGDMRDFCDHFADKMEIAKWDK